MPLRAQYPIFGRRTHGFDARQNYIKAIHAEIAKRIPTRFLRLFYVPVTPLTERLYRWQLPLLEDPDSITHITTNSHSFLLRERRRSPTVITCYHIAERRTNERLGLADRVICSSQYVKRELAAFMNLPYDPEVVHLAVPPSFAPADVPREPGRILFVATEQKRKNVDGLFRILARVVKERPATLVKVGPASPERPSLQALARDLGIEERIVWRDFVPEEELISLYRTSTVAVMPSFHEGFSMPCLEAMSTGCPLVASNLTAIPELVGSGGVLLDPHDEGAWADALLRILGDPALAGTLSRRGIERSKAFSAARSAEQVLRIYEEVWRERRGG